MKFIEYLIIPLLLISLYGGCNGNNGGNSGDTEEIILDNLCFLSTSENPCYDPNEGSESGNIDDMTVAEVIADLEENPGYVKQLEFSEIVSTIGRSIFLPPVREGCSWDDRGLVIKTANDWDNYRNNCYFTDNFFDPPDVDFSEKMVIASLKGGTGFGTEIAAVLEFDTEIVVVITDTRSDVESFEAKPFGSSVIETESKDLPVSFVRVQEICNSVFNFSNSECLAESMLNVCEGFHCSSQNFSASPKFSCTFISCMSFHCDQIQTIKNSMVVITNGTFSDISLDELGSPKGLLFADEMQEEFGCSIVVE